MKIAFLVGDESLSKTFLSKCDAIVVLSKEVTSDATGNDAIKAVENDADNGTKNATIASESDAVNVIESDVENDIENDAQSDTEKAFNVTSLKKLCRNVVVVKSKLFGEDPLQLRQGKHKFNDLFAAIRILSSR